MEIKLFVNSADTRICNKSSYLTLIADLTGCRPLDANSIVKPQIVIDWSNSYHNINYAWISDFNRYYFITDVVVKSGGQAILYLDADDRYNWYDFYKNRSAIITRSEKIGSPTAIPDSKLPINPNRHELLTLPILKNGAAAFASDISNCSYVMTVVGNIKETIAEE